MVWDGHLGAAGSVVGSLVVIRIFTVDLRYPADADRLAIELGLKQNGLANTKLASLVDHQLFLGSRLDSPAFRPGAVMADVTFD